MKYESLKKKKLPDSPGVYFFLDKRKKPLYIGKATSLRDRVRSYFAKDIAEVRSALIEKLVGEAQSIDFKTTDSTLEALLLEADLIKKFKPHYNSREKDDKSFNCVVVTDENFPKLLVIRKKDINLENCRANGQKLKHVFGPYPQGASLKEALKIIRKIFPWRDDKCILFEDQIKKTGKSKPCFMRQIGLCPGTCTGEISKQDYARTIRNLTYFFRGKKKELVRLITKEMNACAKELNFEKAEQYKRIIFALEHINDVSMMKNDFLAQSQAEDTTRIEFYDIAHLGGSSMVGVMTVVCDGEPKKSEYRQFHIRSTKTPDDTKALKEILERRLKHSEWQFPNFIVADGGIAQKNALESVLGEYKLSIPVIAIVKDEKHKPKGFLGNESLIKKYKRDIVLGNSEAHRFAITFHKKTRRRKFLG